jgi:formate-dependent nitrite reductase cytochrome c552 subunit
VIPKFADDDTNSRTDSVLLMHVGTGNGYTGIHGAHMGPGVTIRFAADDAQRQKIPWVQYERTGVRNTTYALRGASASQGAVRVMDCIDCHNRPAHSYELPERAIDKAMADGTIWPGLPQAKKQGLAILKVAYSSQQDALAKIPEAFQSFYRHKYPDVYASHQKEISTAVSQLAAIYSRNVFPEMKVTWAAYPNNLGHTDSAGCFRCHDELHASTDGKKIGQDCSTCHTMIAMDEASPKILGDLGIATK